jgi:hypothetical protein
VGLSPAAANDFFLYSVHPEWFYGPPILLCNGYRGSSPLHTSMACDRTTLLQMGRSTGTKIKNKLKN